MASIDFNKFWWLTPIHGSVPHASFYEMQAICKYQLGMQIACITGETEINSARTKLANLALTNGAEVTLWVDADNAPAPSTVVHLLQQAATTQRPQAAVYARKSGDNPSTQQPTLCLHPARPGVWTMGEGGGPQAVTTTGFGCLAIPRSTYGQLQDQVPTVRWGHDVAMDGPHWFMPEMDGETYLQDDVVFCRRLARANIPIDVWTNHPVVHWKTMGLMPPTGHVRVDMQGKCTPMIRKE